ncbi:MAG TPA: TIM44-like domain-containing protein [Rhodocyclaceae bacterium]
MLKPLSLSVLALIVGLGFAPSDAEAKRLGGARSFGMQRQATPPAKAPAAAPAPTQAPAGAPAAQPKRSWMGPIAGLAAGLGLAALASHLGLGEELASMLLIGLLIVGGIIVFRLLTRRASPAPRPAMAGASPYAAHEPPAAPTERAPLAGSHGQAMPGSVADSFAKPDSAAPRIPADFDVVAFSRNAKVNFVRLQAANDAGDLDDLRAFTTPEMFAELKMDIAERGSAPQHTDVVEIDAEVIEAVEEGSRYVVSVRFRGQLREEEDGPLVTIDELWHLVKPREGKAGWLLAGIQQTQ